MKNATLCETMRAWLHTQGNRCAADRRALEADGRQDEAVFARIRQNVYEIFDAVLTAADRTCADEAARRRFFAGKLADISGSWQTAQQKAAAAGEQDKVHIEALKLAAAADIRAALRQMEGKTA